MLPLLLFLPVLYISALYSYLLFHTVVEVFCVMVAASVFLFTWNSRHIMKNNYFFFMGVTYLCVGLIDFVHALAYKGMPIFVGSDANLPTQLWVAGRYLLAASLIIAPVFIHRQLSKELILGIYLVLTGVLLLVIFEWRIFPVSYIEGVGLTPFKRISEYVISLMLLGSVVVLMRIKHKFDSQVFRYLVVAFGLNIVSELLFTEYVGVYDLLNEIGHFAKLIAYYLVYKAVIEIGLAQPYNLLFLDLQQLQRQKDELMGIASHELKNPLTSIGAYASLLKSYFKNTRDNKHLEFVTKIQTHLRRINGLVDELMDVSKIESGTTKITLSRFDFSELVSHIVGDFEQMMQDHQIHLTCRHGIRIRGDRDHLSQVVINLITNAIKYSPKHSDVIVRVKADLKSVTLTVQDRGVGIPKNMQRAIFQKYYRTRTARAQNQGLGLGLYICKDIVKRHSGKIWVTSEVGKGSIFHVNLPIK